MNCEEVIGSIVALLDDEVAAEERTRLEGHLASCAACQGELRRLRATRVVVGRHLAAAAVTAGSFEDLWQRVEGEPTAAVRARQAPDPRGVVHDLGASRRAQRAGLSPRGAARARGLPAWATVGGLAAAAVLALVVVGRQSDREPAGTAPASPPMVVARDDAAPPAPDANAPARARVAAKRA
ncbi:MAG: zf-HC2 domain-containing protein, partial [Thermodesulfobacteriota bacterium]